MDEETILEKLRKFNAERDWDQFHSGENLAKSICIEAAELLELFQWDHKEKSLERLEEELADVLTYCYMMADVYKLSPAKIMMEKLAKNELKYPVEKAKGSNKKYDEFD
ncbi:MAG: nucleotide pyrophosphohydrolase [Bacillota bacterium]|nr:nucleotide pyrophosphohydrolase [Bacillota bacterium]